RALPAPEGGAESEVAFVAPRTATEELVAAIWREVLRVPRVGMNDDFFALGGHSLLATTAMARLAQALRVVLPLRTLFEVKTAAALAAVADLVAGAASPPRVTGADVEEGEL